MPEAILVVFVRSSSPGLVLLLPPEPLEVLRGVPGEERLDREAALPQEAEILGVDLRVGVDGLSKGGPVVLHLGVVAAEVPDLEGPLAPVHVALLVRGPGLVGDGLGVLLGGVPLQPSQEPAPSTLSGVLIRPPRARLLVPRVDVEERDVGWYVQALTRGWLGHGRVHIHLDLRLAEPDDVVERQAPDVHGTEEPDLAEVSAPHGEPR